MQPYRVFQMLPNWKAWRCVEIGHLIKTYLCDNILTEQAAKLTAKSVSANVFTPLYKSLQPQHYTHRWFWEAVATLALLSLAPSAQTHPLLLYTIVQQHELPICAQTTANDEMKTSKKSTNWDWSKLVFFWADINVSGLRLMNGTSTKRTTTIIIK